MSVNTFYILLIICEKQCHYQSSTFLCRERKESVKTLKVIFKTQSKSMILLSPSMKDFFNEILNLKWPIYTTLLAAIQWEWKGDKNFSNITSNSNGSYVSKLPQKYCSLIKFTHTCTHHMTGMLNEKRITIVQMPSILYGIDFKMYLGHMDKKVLKHMRATVQFDKFPKYPRWVTQFLKLWESRNWHLKKLSLLK